MRKIKTMADIEKVRKRNNIILGIVMIALLVGSSLGYSLMGADRESEDTVEFGGFDFVRDGGMWKLSIGDEVFGFQNLPSEVSDVDVNISVELGMYNGQPLYFVNLGDGVNEILGNIGKYTLRYQESCLQEASLLEKLEIRDQNLDDLGDLTSGALGDEAACEGDLPIKDCSSNLIVFEEGNSTRVYSEGNCVFITGDVLRGSDAFLYKLLDII
jgi:hypothetical protein